MTPQEEKYFYGNPITFTPSIIVESEKMKTQEALVYNIDGCYDYLKYKNTEFVRSYDGDCYTLKLIMSLKVAVNDMFNYIFSNFDVTSYKVFESKNWAIDVKYNDKPILIVSYGYDSNDDTFEMREKTSYTFLISGKKEDVFAIKEKMRVDHSTHNVPSVTWKFVTERGTSERDININIDVALMDECYPYIEGGLKNYYESYLSSQAQVLLLLGEPGTGKTSFIREFIIRSNLKTVLTYDEKLMNSDSFFIDFITGDTNLLVIEDADVLLSKRESGNDQMAKLLNVSDGLVKFNDKKIIFSTNLTSINMVDDALLRPGRCFDIIRFRKLKGNEANIVSQKQNLNKTFDDSKEYSLGEIFFKEEKKKARFGF